MAHKKTWQEKLKDSRDFPKVSAIAGKMTKRWGSGTFVIPAPLEVDELMRKVPKGRLTTIDQMCQQLARRHGATITCPITTGIFAWIAAHAADEAQKSGQKRITPYWRTLKSDGTINEKYPGGLKNLAARLKTEGHTVIKKGSRHKVADYDQVLIRPR